MKTISVLFTSALAFLAVIATSNAQEASPPRINLLVLHGTAPRVPYGGLTRKEARQVFAEAVAPFAGIVDLKITTWKSRKVRPNIPRGHIELALKRYARHFAKPPSEDLSPTIAIALIPPLVDYQGKRTVNQGIAAPICGSRVAVAAGPWDFLGQELRLRPVTVILAHELAHALGAQHQAGVSVMNPDPTGTAYRSGWLPLGLSAENVEQIRECVAGRLGQ